ncbi:hypothetical protein H0R92_06065 [Treponema sp. OMZ 840]|uniref:hypothetical protein n=1 Tax=Treponema sp. OMZ 840 TaxID=244313 RepID=UPI003D8A6E98
MYDSIKLFAFICAVLFILAGCTARASIIVNEDKSASIGLKTESGETLVQTLTAFTGTSENKTLFNEKDVRAGFEKASFTLKHLSFSGKTGMVLTADCKDLRKVDSGGALTLESDTSSDTLTLTFSPQTLNNLLKLMPDETAEYTDLLMAPAFTGEQLNETEYSEIIGNMYGSTLQKELISSFFIFDVGAPAEITHASIIPPEAGSVRINGKKASFNLYLNKFLSNSEKIKIRIQWKK